MKNKRQSVVSKFSLESEYRVMSNVTLELVWIKNLLTEIGFPSECLLILYGHKKTANTLLKMSCSMRELNTLKLIVI